MTQFPLEGFPFPSRPWIVDEIEQPLLVFLDLTQSKSSSGADKSGTSAIFVYIFPAGIDFFLELKDCQYTIAWRKLKL